MNIQRTTAANHDIAFANLSNTCQAHQRRELMTSTLKNSLSLALFAFIFVLAASAYAAPTQYTSLTDYNNAVGSLLTTIDTFDGPTTSDADTIVTDIGILSETANGSMALPSQFYNHPDFDLSEFGFVLDRLGGTAPRNILWTMPANTIGFYGEWVTVTGADVSINGLAGPWFDISEAINPNPNAQNVEGFWGIVDPDGITDVAFRVDPAFGNFEIFWLTSMAITQVPEPASATLIGLAAAALAFPRRRR
ncbi:MAG: hypothetical protein AAGA92_10935 [Planctomycetota bacterium]